MALSRAAIMRDSVSLLRFPFLSQVQVFWCGMLLLLLLLKKIIQLDYLAYFSQSAGAVEYTDCLSATSVLDTTLYNLMVRFR